MLATGAGGAVNLHFNVLGANFHIVGGIRNFRDHLHRSKRGLPPGIGVKGRHPHQAVHAVLTLQKAVGVGALNHDVRRF